MENAGEVAEGQAMYEVGERVQIASEHDVFPDEEGKIVDRGVGQGFHAGDVVYDILIDGTEEPWRFSEDEIADAVPW